MSAQGARKPTEEDWLVQKPTLKKLWLDGRKKLLGKDGVVETMKAEHNFSASKWQYEKRFRGWNWNRNRKKGDWEQLSAVIHERERQGKESDVYIDGEPQSRDKIRKEISRYHPSTYNRLSFASTQQLPKSFTIRTPTSDRTVSLTFDLPFHTFEKHLRLGNNRPWHQNWSWPNFPADPLAINPRLTLYDEADAEDSYPDGSLGSIGEIETLERQPSFEASSTLYTASDFWTPEGSVLTTLKSVVPRSIAEEVIPSSFVMSPSTQIFTSSLHRQTLFSVANNFAGLDSFPVKDIIHFLQKETNENFYQLVRPARSYSSRMIVQNIFKAAVEVGDARIVDVLIRENPKDIKINEQFCSVKGFRYTPIERATKLRYEDVVKVLLKHGADVKRTQLESSRGVLDYVVEHRDDGSSLKLDPHPQIFQSLLEAGGDLSRLSMVAFVKRGERKLVILLMAANGRKNAAEWSEWGVFRDAMTFLDDHTSMEIVKIMLKYGIDLNYHIKFDRVHRPCRVIDAAAQRGNLILVKLLLDSGALLTDDTLPYAIASGNQDLILLLLARGADVNSIGRFGDTPLAAAIRLQDAQVLKLIEDRGASVMIQEDGTFSAELEAALEVGNIHFIERWIQHEGKTSPLILGYALMLATRGGWDELAKNLIDAGADVNVSSRGRSSGGNGPPLCEALKRRNEALVLLLLNADANPDFSLALAPPIILAAEWGNRSVIENLIFAGADVDAPAHFGYRRIESALSIAVKRQDRELIQYLLASGADLHNREYQVRTPLQAAAENGDLEMVGFLLDQGADPKDSAALTATLENEKLFDLLFERCCARYPMNWGKSGAEILAEAIAQGNERVIRLMLERRLNANIMIELDLQTATPFGHAIGRQQVNLEQFLQNGCNPNDVVAEATWDDFDGSSPPVTSYRQIFINKPRLRVTALLAAIGTRNTSTVELFIRYGADVNFPTRGPVKRTPLQRAAEIGNLDIVELLVNHGANVNAPAAERGGGTALQLAAIGGYIPLVCRLVSLKADVNAPRSKVNGRTALEGAAEHGRLDMVKLLLNGGAGSEYGGEGQIANAIALARDNAHFPICDLLESHLSSRRQGSGRVMLADANNEDFTDWTLDDDFFDL